MNNYFNDLYQEVYEYTSDIMNGYYVEHKSSFQKKKIKRKINKKAKKIIDKAKIALVVITVTLPITIPLIKAMKRELQELNDAAKKERDEKKARKKKYENEIDECQRYRRLLKNHESYIYSLLKSVEGLEQSYSNPYIDITDKEKEELTQKQKDILKKINESTEDVKQIANKIVGMGKYYNVTPPPRMNQALFKLSKDDSIKTYNQFRMKARF